MAVYLRIGLALTGIGLLCMLFGLIWAADLFGVATEHARRIIASRWQPGGRSMPLERAVLIGRITGVGFMIFSLGFVVPGILMVIRGPG